MSRTGISWTNETWNPVTGCSHVSPGCVNCYAESLSLRRGWSKTSWTAQNAAENVKLHPDRLDQPLRWRKPRRVFVNSMSDLFHERIPDAFIAHVFAVMAAAYQHTFQVLTKRPERMRDLLSREDFWTLATLQGVEQWWGPGDLVNADLGVSAPLSNVWLGVSVEDQRRADERIPLLLETPAAVRFLSCEPLLDWIQLSKVGTGPWFDALNGWGLGTSGIACTLPSGMVSWVIVGGESGPGYRPMRLEWVQSLADECRASHVPLFVKQDSGAKPGKQGRLPAELWARKEFPVPVPA